MAKCPECNHANPSDARFCQNCGKKLVLICRRCGTENLRDTQYCKSCGVKLAEAKFSISDDFAQKSWKNFTSFSVYSEMTAASGWVRQKAYPFAKQLIEASDVENKSLLDEKMAFFLPVINRDWCISFLGIDKTTIKYGSLWAGTSGFAILDFDKQLLFFLPYEWLDNCKQDGDNISLTNNKGSTISLAIRVSRPSDVLNVLGFIGDLIGLLFGVIWAIFGQAPLSSDADKVIDERRREQNANDRQARISYADSYVESISDFFSKIIAMKNDIERIQKT